MNNENYLFINIKKGKKKNEKDFIIIDMYCNDFYTYWL